MLVTMLAAGLIVFSLSVAYYTSFDGVFIYDDLRSIVANRTIRQLWPIWQPLSPPRGGDTVSGRPLLNLSLAVNYALDGLHVRGYHAANLLIHIAAALALFGILRRTFLLPTLRDRFGAAATPLALAGALVWALHPLQTESVTYIVQRAESLMGFFYLLTLYCVICGAAGTVPLFAPTKPMRPGVMLGEKGDCPPGSAPGTVPLFAAHEPVSRSGIPGEKGDCPPRAAPVWYAAAVLACLLGMACKEVMVTAPPIVLLYDRTFLAGSFAEAVRRRWGLYLGLAATWGLSTYLVLSTGLLGRQPEIGSPDSWSYARSQPGVILHYLRLSFWPHPLCLDYAWPVASSLGEILPSALVIGALFAATVWGLMRRSACGFLGAWFFLTLAPTSSVLPLNQLAFEHRMYLALAPVVVLVVAGEYALWDRLLAPRPSPLAPGPSSGTAPRLHSAAVARWAAPVAVLSAALLALGSATAARNRDYRSLLVIWQDTAEKRPDNHAAHYNLGLAMASAGKIDEALERYREALRLHPGFPEAHNNLANLLTTLGKTDEAIAHCRQALRAKPNFADAHYTLGFIFAGLGKSDEAIAYCNEALRLNPDSAEAHNTLAAVLLAKGKTAAAIEHFQEAVRLNPDYVVAHSNLGAILAREGRFEKAIAHYQEALRIDPGYVAAHSGLGNILAKAGRAEEAIEHCQQALRLTPDDVMTHNNLGNVLLQVGRTREAIEHYDQALRLKPDFAAALINLAWLLATRQPAQGGDPERAVTLAQRARQLSGQENAQCLDTLAAAYAAAGRFSDAAITAERAVQVAASTGQTPLAKDIQARLELYRAGRPFRQSPRSPEHSHL
jgi:tetratricopeptide (TPR) repeat protein